MIKGDVDMIKKKIKCSCLKKKINFFKIISRLGNPVTILLSYSLLPNDIAHCHPGAVCGHMSLRVSDLSITES